MLTRNAELDEEMGTPLDMVTEAHVERGASRRNAESTARVRKRRTGKAKRRAIKRLSADCSPRNYLV
ncbi:MAG: hypothetical protein DMG41_20155 [Acidobacteria bacterium]|nr:MAG: hypothetical protein AUH13_01100 [Acidobacteria bacterium 13_2_20CM_58_27]PYT77884.1 MAG: hypothetical protein DMG42_01710 [Acidobacteriota bacterium]PYT86321.1 MAG: hypothetical protein DMG41_20155 [Acidobacteriota bacterium]